jgi:hypothetical protein
MTFKVGKSVLIQFGKQHQPTELQVARGCTAQAPCAGDHRKPIRERLEEAVKILDAIEQRRAVEGRPQLGWAIEQAIINRELQQLEKDFQTKLSLS